MQGIQRRRNVTLRVCSRSAAATTGWLQAGWMRFPCALGRSGQAAAKREGDGATPRGRFVIWRVLYRADRLRRPGTGLPIAAIQRDDGWCDAPDDRNYNRPVRHPYRVSAEAMWREDGLYDVVVVISHNQRPRVRGHGSAVFIHCAREGYEPTAGCVALRRIHLLRVLASLGRGACILIGAAQRRR